MAKKIKEKPKLLARKNTGSLAQLIQTRHSSRGPFNLNHPVPAKALRQILEAARWAPTAHNMQNYEIIVVDDRATLGKIGNIQSGLSADFIKENYRQLSFTSEEFLKKKRGVLADTFPPSWRTEAAAKGQVVGIEPRSLWDTIHGGPLLLILLYDSTKRAPASQNDALGFMSLGCVMENMWLTAQSLGLGLQIISALSSNMVGEAVENEARKILNFPGDRRIAFTCRVGYPLAQPAHYLRVRREVKDFTHMNAYRRPDLDWKEL
jgi:nitroreductase